MMQTSEPVAELDTIAPDLRWCVGQLADIDASDRVELFATGRAAMRMLDLMQGRGYDARNGRAVSTALALSFLAFGAALGVTVDSSAALLGYRPRVGDGAPSGGDPIFLRVNAHSAAVPEPRKALAFMVETDAMEPIFLRGRIAYASPAMPVGDGDYVIIELKPENGDAVGPTLIKQLVCRTGRGFLVRCLNRAIEPTEVPAAAVRNLYRVPHPADWLGE